MKREKDERIESLKVYNQLPSNFRVCELIHDQWRLEIQWNIRFKIKVNDTLPTTGRILINMKNIGQCFMFKNSTEYWFTRTMKVRFVYLDTKNLPKYTLWRIIASSKLLFASKNVRLGFTRMEHNKATISK